MKKLFFFLASTLAIHAHASVLLVKEYGVNNTYSTISAAITAAVLLGLGTGLVYPNFLTVVAENARPTQRAEVTGVFRFWRDMGYVVGALLSGVLADWLGLETALYAIAAITAGAGLIANVRMCCTLKVFWRSQECSPAV